MDSHPYPLYYIPPCGTVNGMTKKDDLHLRHLETPEGIECLGSACAEALRVDGEAHFVVREDGEVRCVPADVARSAPQILELLDELDPTRAVEHLLRWGTSDAGAIAYLEGRKARQQGTSGELEAG